MTPDELIDKLQRYRDMAVAAMPEVAMAMADEYKDHLTHVTLRQRYAAPDQFGTPSPPGSPVAWRTGKLAESVTSWPGASSGMSATAHVAPHTIYAGVQEYGREIFAKRFEYMHWVNGPGDFWQARAAGGHSYSWHPTGGSWYAKRVFVPPRPYLQPALEDVVADGSLLRAASLRFRLATVGWNL